MAKAVLGELLFNDKVWNSTTKAIGRDSESSKLLGIFCAGQGSTTLVAGDRGSGKTTTIRNALVESAKQRARTKAAGWHHWKILWTWTAVYQVAVDVPLLPSILEEKSLKTNILRLIVQTLISDWSTKRLWDKLKLPVTYHHKLKELEATIKYKRVVRRNGLSASATHSSLSVGGNSSAEYEIDLSYIDLELLLKAFFTRFSKQLNFVVIFDELDKYEAINPDIKPHMYISELKNLFTLSNAKFVFTSTEDYYHEVDEKARSNAVSLDDYKFSLFTHKMLINHLAPDKFNTYLRSLFQQIGGFPTRVELFNKLKYYLMWTSNLYPFAAKKLLVNMARNKADGSSYIDLEDIESDLNSYGQGGLIVLQHTLNEVYKSHEVDNDEFFDRLLYLSLKRVVTVFYSNSFAEIKINKSNFFALIYEEKHFTDSAERQTFFGGEFGNFVELDFEDNEGWERRLGDLESSRLYIINSAITELVWDLCAMGLIEAKTDPSNISTVGLVYNAKDLTYEDARRSYNGVFQHIRKLEKTRSDYIRKLTQAAKHTGLDVKMPALFTVAVEGQSVSGEKYGLGWDLADCIEEDNGQLQKTIDELPALIHEGVKAYITSKYSQFRKATYYTQNSPTIYEVAGKRWVILVSPDQELVDVSLGNQAIDNIIVINPLTKLSRAKNLKVFSMVSETYHDYQKILSMLDGYISEQDTKG